MALGDSDVPELEASGPNVVPATLASQAALCWELRAEGCLGVSMVPHKAKRSAVPANHSFRSNKLSPPHPESPARTDPERHATYCVSATALSAWVSTPRRVRSQLSCPARSNAVERMRPLFKVCFHQRSPPPVSLPSLEGGGWGEQIQPGDRKTERQGGDYKTRRTDKPPRRRKGDRGVWPPGTHDTEQRLLWGRVCC